LDHFFGVAKLRIHEDDHADKSQTKIVHELDHLSLNGSHLNVAETIDEKSAAPIPGQNVHICVRE
jgi:hypothetical protein